MRFFPKDIPRAFLPRDLKALFGRGFDGAAFRVFPVRNAKESDMPCGRTKKFVFCIQFFRRGPDFGNPLFFVPEKDSVAGKSG